MENNWTILVYLIEFSDNELSINVF